MSTKLTDLATLGYVLLYNHSAGWALSITTKADVLRYSASTAETVVNIAHESTRGMAYAL